MSPGIKMAVQEHRTEQQRSSVTLRIPMMPMQAGGISSTQSFSSFGGNFRSDGQ